MKKKTITAAKRKSEQLLKGKKWGLEAVYKVETVDGRE